MQLEKLFKEAMARLPGAVTVITTAEDGVYSGLVATAMCSLSTEPPSVVVCVNKTASAHDSIVRRGAFGVSVLTPEQTHIVKQFQENKGADRFKNLGVHVSEMGVPLLENARLALDCVLEKTYDGYSHTILVGLVKSVVLNSDSQAHCLLWQGRGFHRATQLES